MRWNTGCSQANSIRMSDSPDTGRKTIRMRIRGGSLLRREFGCLDTGFEVNVRVVIIEDSAPVQGMLREALTQVDGIEVAGVASTCRDASQLVEQHQPATAILDLQLEDGSSIPHIPRFLEARPGMAIIVFSLHVDPAICEKVMKAGAAYCLDKNGGVEPVVEAVQQIRSVGLRKQ